MDNKKTVYIVVAVIFVGVASLCYGLGALNDTNTENLMIESTSERVTQESESVTELLSQEEIFKEIYVHVCGEVVNPGVYVVKDNTRLIEVIELAGGFTKDAASDSINLAQSVSDGQRVEIPSYTDIINMSEEEKKQLISETHNQEINSERTNSGSLVNINTASESELMTLNGIGQSKARSIIDYRETHGLFKNIEDIKNVVGIKDAVFNNIKNLIIVD